MGDAQSLPDEPLQLPRQLGEFQLEELIGKGGTSLVYRALQTSLEREVAVKVLRSTSLPADLLARSLREARLLGRLQHDHIVSIYAAGMEDGLFYFAMPLISGGALDTWLAARGPRQVGVRFLAEVSGALAYAHEMGVIHRDVKPGNVIIHNDQALLIDFGLARIVEATTITRGMFVGTPRYFSPEQARLERATFRSDIFATGVMLYEVLTGRHPFSIEGECAQEMLGRIIRAECLPPTAHDPSISPALERTTLQALQPDPLRRQASAAELQAQLLAASG